ncbi:unnamed protein product [Prorocentrum cordatum]|uniref:RING-type domain-containing protein n=1 Tax=Prorocentrum cordatum TaxID=2364126 RepID=A0ABN9SFK5_9DINO|nr:unnamed protein product [Polarella glacialis]
MSAYYGENANYQIPQEPPPSVMYAMQSGRTTGAARLVWAEIQRLTDEGVTIPSKGDAASNKLEYLTTQMKVYDSIIAIFSTRDFLISSMAAKMDDAQVVVSDNYYQEMTQTLQVMENGFRRVVGLPESWYVNQYKKAMEFVMRHRIKIAGLGFAVAGGAAGACQLVYVQYKMCVFAGLTGACASASVIAGGILAAVVYLIGTLVVNALLSGGVEDAATAAEKEKRNALNRMVKELKGMSPAETLQQLKQLRIACNEIFCRPACEPDERCLICSMEFETDPEAPGEEPVRAIRCTGRHFMHERCRAEWVGESGRMECPTCGV